MNSNPPTQKILILSANPRGTSRLRLDEEMREIKEGLRRAKRREQFQIETAEALRYRDIHRAILDAEPNLVHFSGHGTGEEGLVFEDEAGQAKLVEAEALAGLFELFVDKLECVVLNACYSQVQAEAIAQHIPYVIGMSKAIGDQAAIEFAVGFYDALGAGRGVEFAYKLGCNAIDIAGIPERLTPQLLANRTLVPTPPSPEEEQNVRDNPQGAIKRKKIIILSSISTGIAAILLWVISVFVSSTQQPPSTQQPQLSLNNQEIKGRLTAGDKLQQIPPPPTRLQDSPQIRYFDEYFFQGSQGDKTQIEMTSQDFDPYLELFAPNGQKIAGNDDISLGNPNARIEITLLDSGIYRLITSSSPPEQQGTYSLRGKIVK